MAGRRPRSWVGLLWREYPRRKSSLKNPKRRFLGAWQGMGEYKPTFQKCYGKETSDQLGGMGKRLVV